MNRNIIKKIIIALLTIICATILFLGLTGCSFNKQIFDFQYNYNYVYIYDLNETYEVEKWTDYEDGEQLQITLKDGTVMLISSVSCILYSGEDNYFEK